MLQHRHNFPGYEGPTSSNEGWWHDVNMKHVKYPTAHDQPILGTREFTPGTRKGKQPKLTLSFNEWGEPLTPEDVDPALALYKSPPEYAALEDPEKVEAIAEATTVLELAAAITQDADARMAARGITPNRRK